MKKEASQHLHQLCRYYLECISQDRREVSAPSGKTSKLLYATLDNLPAISSDKTWQSKPEVLKILNEVERDKSSLAAYIGYPVLLTKYSNDFSITPIFLWGLSIPEKPSCSFEITDDKPLLNLKFLSTIDRETAHDEIIKLADFLNLDNFTATSLAMHELMKKIKNYYPKCSWQEDIDPNNCQIKPALTEIQELGIYNRVVIIAGEKQKYTLGLEYELKQLSDVSDADIADTALGKWLSGKIPRTASKNPASALQVLPMNEEQKTAVESGLVGDLTVITGPPGTGKSQVVVNLLVNAAQAGQSILFASKNNKAVDVVESRVNGLSTKPMLLRLGSNYKEKMRDYYVSILSDTSTHNGDGDYHELMDRYKNLVKEWKKLNETQLNIVKIRNKTDALEREIQHCRDEWSDRFCMIDKAFVNNSKNALETYEQSIASLNEINKKWLQILWLKLTKSLKTRALNNALKKLTFLAEYLTFPKLPNIQGLNLAEHCSYLNAAKEIHRKFEKILEYKNQLDLLLSETSLEVVAVRKLKLAKEMVNCSNEVLQIWIDAISKNITQEQRKEISEYLSISQLVNGSDGHSYSYEINKKWRSLQSKLQKIFRCIAVTSLSARGKVLFEPSCFDLLVIDEASQCDIASAIPLLYRAKRAVIIGDPQQLRHISCLDNYQELRLQKKYNLIESLGRASWIYSVNSLYDLASSICPSDHIIVLKDHHRSHPNIIEFSNREFYNGKLSIVTRENMLNIPKGPALGVSWQDVKGKTTRPEKGSAINDIEAKAVVQILRRILVNEAYDGTIGVVTPFQAQTQLIKKLIAESEDLGGLDPKHCLLADTVHGFQGDERDIMIFSPVISKDAGQGAIRFLQNNKNLFNVAVTRARTLLQVVGDKETILDSEIEYLKRFVRYTEDVATSLQSNVIVDKKTLKAKYPTVSKPEQVSLWEKMLYEALYQAGLRPIPQYPIEYYNLDFALIQDKKKLNIEVDGERYHKNWTGELCLRDELRNQRLAELGWDIKRFWVYQIRDRLAECVEEIKIWKNGIESTNR